MSENGYALRQRWFSHFLWLGAMPAAVHLLFALLFGSEADTSAFMLFGSLATAACVGMFLSKKSYGAAVSMLAAVWPVVPASLGHWHWAAGMASPGGSAQALVRWAGWTDASMTASLAALSAAAAGAGWAFMLFDRFYKRKTGHSLFEES